MDRKYDYIIKSVVSKREEGYVNKYHAQVLGAKCAIGLLEVGYKCGLVVDVFNTDGEPWNKWLYTSPVESVKTNENGEMIIETMNSTYVLAPIKGGDPE